MKKEQTLSRSGRRLLSLVVLLLLMALVAWASQPDSIPTEGDASSAPPKTFVSFAAVGADDKGSVAAKTFLYGHQEASWPLPSLGATGVADAVKHLHNGAPSAGGYRSYYRDASLSSGEPDPGRDEDPVEGLEAAVVVYYAGHGEPERLQAGTSSTYMPLRELSLGDGPTRYWLMRACKVLAHGRKSKVHVGQDYEDFVAPSAFLSSAGAPELENAFTRWGQTYDNHLSPLHHRLRLACGGSSDLGGDDHPSADFWRLKRIEGLPVADSFLLGFGADRRTPACMTRGPKEVKKTPLFDADFNPDPNAGGNFVYLTYPVRPEVNETVQLGALRFAPVPTKDEAATVGELSRLGQQRDLSAATTLSAALELRGARELPLGFLGFERGLEGANPGGQAWVKGLGFDPTGTALAVHPESGAFRLSFAPPNSTTKRPTLEQLLGLVKKIRSVRGRLAPEPDLELAEPPKLVRFDRVASDRVRDSAPPIDCFLSCLSLRFRDRLEVQGRSMSVANDGGDWLFRVCDADLLPEALLQELGFPPESYRQNGKMCQQVGDGSLSLSFSLARYRQVPERRARGLSRPAWLTLDQAAETAWAKLQERHPRPCQYDRKRFRWELTYLQAQPHCAQEHLLLNYRITFLPREGKTGFLPQSYDVPALKYPSTADAGIACAER